MSQYLEFFFIPPIYTFQIKASDDIAIAISFFVVASITGILNSLAKNNQKLLRNQEIRTKTLYQLSLEIINAENKEECIESISNSLSKLFNASISIAIVNKDEVLNYFKKGKDWILNQPKELAVAQYAFDKKISCGKWTDTLPDAQSLFVPLVAKSAHQFFNDSLDKSVNKMISNANNTSVGVLAFYPEEKSTPLTVLERETLFTICSQLAIYLEREIYFEYMSDRKGESSYTGL